MAKKEMEFFDCESVALTPSAGSIRGLNERILASDPVSGVATRILIFEPGTDTSPLGVQIHDFWEEVYIISGEFFDLTLKMSFKAGMYACRPPGMRHGPWVSKGGCRTFEVRYKLK
ncbi:MAG: cupin [Thermoplasmatales archaeon B_DKE]|nr:MAG: cupin [Thermoplasmatales archaeon B_DKE]OWP57392.1 MAG: cupin [Thermoplasmatales archaeon B_DKE]